jgi:exodeoxyribonuclease V alpha subunit
MSALQAWGVDGLLGTFHEAGVLGLADVHVARRLGVLAGEGDEQVLLACALAVRAVRSGSVCVDLARVRSSVPDDEDAVVDLTALPWPQASPWLAACARSPLVADADDPWTPLRLVDGLLYLDRYFQQEQVVRRSLDERLLAPPPVLDSGALRSSLARLFPGPAPDRQRLAVAVAATRWVTVLAGGPGTGKTTTVARLLAALRDQPGPTPRIALAAPTGKAAARLSEAVRGAGLGLDLPASTLHRLLGWRPGNRSRFRHDRTHHLPYDVVVVDETSMVSLTLMSRLLEAVRPDARLILVGDPDQLASVEAGAVLGDLVARSAVAASGTGATADDTADPLSALVPEDLTPDDRADPALGNGVVRLSRIWRFGGEIAALASAVRDGDGDAAVRLLRAGGPVSLVEDGSVTDVRADVLRAARPLVEAARAGDATGALAVLDEHRLLCAHRRGPYGVGHWSEEVASWLAAAGLRPPGSGASGEWAAGRAVIVTSNDHELQLYNGDTGVLVEGPRGPVAAFPRAGGPLLLSPSRLPTVQSIDALTVHRCQGSQFTAVTLMLPPPESPLLTRELLYTALSRATQRVRIIGSEDAVRAAVARPIVRASGLRRAAR